MKAFSLFALVVALGLWTASVLRTDHGNEFSGTGVTAAQNSDGAFRDGLYLGKLAAESGVQSHVAIGRWATREDRSSFAAGYEEGYREFVASRVSSTMPQSRAE